MSFIKRFILIGGVFLTALFFVLIIKYYLQYQENIHLVEKYSEPIYIEDYIQKNARGNSIDEYVQDNTVELLDAQTQDASISKSKYRNKRSVPNKSNVSTNNNGSVNTPSPIIATTSSFVSSTTKTLLAPPIISTQKTIDGIAAGYVLTGKNESQLRDYFSLLKTLGITWVRFDIDWSQVQRNGENSYSWTEVDLVLKIANEYNLKTLAILSYAPKWAAQEGCINLCAPKNPETYAQFAAVAATRYKNSVSAWEIWNEPNADYFWSPKANASDYTELLKQAYVSIKKVDPNATIITGGLSPVTASATTINPIDFISTMYSNGGKGNFDAISHHPYTYNLSPASLKPWNHWYQMYRIYDLMNQNGDAGKKIWITEFGVPTGGSGKVHELGDVTLFSFGRDYMSQTAQTTMMLDLMSEINKIKSWVGPVFWYSLIDIDSNSSDPEGHFGLIKSNKDPKNAYQSLLHLSE